MVKSATCITGTYIWDYFPLCMISCDRQQGFVTVMQC